MLQANTIRQERERILEGLTKRHFPDLGIIDRILALDDDRRKYQASGDEILAEINRLSKQIGDLFKSGQAAEANALKEEVAARKETLKDVQEHQDRTAVQLEELLITVPNIPHSSVPEGRTPEDNEVFQDWTKPMPDLPPDAKPHWELAEAHGIIDFPLGVKITGSGFPLYRGKGASLQRALINFFLDEARQAGFEEIQPPLMVNADSARATGQLPDKEGQMYYVEKDDLYLIPTAEVPVTNIYRDVILEEKQLPIKMTGYTPCFRREAGAYGKDVRGLNRVHQFDKVEIVVIDHPSRSYQTLDMMLDHVRGLLDKLELPYRILRLCGGDMSFTSALTYDFEVWSAAQGRWLEVSSVSNFETFQSHRMKLRYRPEDDKKTQLPHTLNGSALALARIVAALLENNQDSFGIRIPEVLHRYTGFDRIP
ncbi:MAG: serine--tRNA ligase [Lewinellaceae bacterium]|nr:serine--tRNA ligase [Saprospiraceae bacterium]MCB9313696.1 serine--tRNA ligase [Lewinellaceae bacterium]